MIPLFNQDALLPKFEKFGRTINPEADPTKTRVLRSRFERQVRRRWRDIMKSVQESIVKNDVFGLRGITNQADPLPAKSFAFMEPAEQIKAFLVWLKEQENRTILQDTPQRWITPFLNDAIARGIIRGRRDLLALSSGPRLVTNQEGPKELLSSLGVLDLDNIDARMALADINRLRSLQIEQTWQGLTGVTEQVNTQVAQVLSQGLAAGVSPSQLASDINGRIEKVGQTRSEMIANTATVEANNRGATAEFAGAEQLIDEEIFVQWQATLDNRVRSTHLARHGKVFKKNEYLQLIGEPRCRCAGLPYIESIEGKAELSKAKTFTAMTPKQADSRVAKIREKEGLRQ